MVELRRVLVRVFTQVDGSAENTTGRSGLEVTSIRCQLSDCGAIKCCCVAGAGFPETVE